MKEPAIATDQGEPTGSQDSAPRAAGPVQPAGGHLFLWGLVGVLALVIFNAGWLIAETWQGPTYSPIADTISDMQAQTAPHVWFPIACFASGQSGASASPCSACGRPSPGLARSPRTRRGCWRSACWPWAILPADPLSAVDAGCTASVQLASPGGLTDAIVAGVAFFGLALSPTRYGSGSRFCPGGGSSSRSCSRPASSARSRGSCWPCHRTCPGCPPSG